MLRKLFIQFFVLLICIVSMQPLRAGDNAKERAEVKFKGGKWGIEANYLTGQFLKHGVGYVPNQLSQGAELNYFKKTYGEKLWHKGMNFPEIGASLTFFYFADNHVFGDAVSVMAFGKFYMVRSKVANFYARIAGGYGIATRTYNPVTNPVDQLISLNLNLAIQVRLGLEWKINQWVQINTAISFNHLSNSGIQLPNYGLNIPSGTIGVRVFPQPCELKYDCTKHTEFNKNEIIWKVSVGVMQLHSFSQYTQQPNTRKYPVPGGMIAYSRYINHGIKFYGGLSYEYFPAIHDYLVTNDIHTHYGPVFDASTTSVILGNEFVMGRLSMFYSAGAYFWKNTATNTPLYFKVGMNLYLAQLRKHKSTSFFFGNNVKAHMNIAQYNEYSIGGTFWK